MMGHFFLKKTFYSRFFYSREHSGSLNFSQASAPFPSSSCYQSYVRVKEANGQKEQKSQGASFRKL